MKLNDLVSKKCGTKTNGRIKYIVCEACTKAGATRLGVNCDKKTCNIIGSTCQLPKDRFFVEWPDGALYSYLETDLDVISAQDQPQDTMLDLPKETKPTTTPDQQAALDTEYKKIIRAGLPDSFSFDNYNRTLPGPNGGQLLNWFGPRPQSKR